MGLLFCDSFDHYKTGSTNDSEVLTQITAKWTNVQFGIATVEAGRTGNGLKLGAGIQIFKTLAHRGEWTVGFAYKTSSGIAYGLESDMYEGLHNNLSMVKLKSNADGTVSIFAGLNTTPIITTDATVAITANKYYYYELNYTVSNTQITATLKINGATVGSGSGNHNRPLTSLLKQTPTVNVHEISASFTSNYIDDFYIYDTGFAGDIKILKVVPNGDVVTTWNKTGGSGTSYSCVNEVPNDGDTSYVSSGTVNNKEIWDWEDIPPFNGNIVGVQVCIYARKNDEGSKAFRIVRGSTGATEHPQDFYVGDNYIYYLAQFDDSWTQGMFNAERFGIKVVV